MRTAVGIAVLAVALAGAGGRAARAQSVKQVSDDACQQVLIYDAEGDTSPAAEHARRACRLQSFDVMLAAERRQAMLADQNAREASIANWLATTQPARVQRPMAIEGFLGTGVATYGVVFSWDVLSQLEVAARVGRREMNCADANGGLNADCTRTLIGLGGRWLILMKDLTPFVGIGFAVTNAHLQVQRYDQMSGVISFLAGDGRAHSGSASAGLQLAISAIRVSAEYVFEYVYYTGANLTDVQQTPSEDLRTVWQQSLDADRHGVRFQVGIAF